MEPLVVSSSFAGKDLLDIFETLLKKRNDQEYAHARHKSKIGLFHALEDEILKQGYLSNNFEEEMVTKYHHKRVNEIEWIPSKASITNIYRGADEARDELKEWPLGMEKVFVPECLFQPSLTGSDAKPLDALVVECVQQVPEELRKEILSHIVLAGKYSQFQNFDGRMRKSLEKAFPSTKVMILEGSHFAVNGAKLLAKTQNFKEHVVSSEQRDNGYQLKFFAY